MMVGAADAMVSDHLVQERVPKRSLRPRGPFSLPTALGFLSCFAPAALPLRGRKYLNVHVISGKATLVELSQNQTGKVELRLPAEPFGSERLEPATATMARIFSLSVDAQPFYGRIGGIDPVLYQLQSEYWGLRPVLFGSPFEALCWAVLSQRTRMSHALKAKRALMEAFGQAVDHAGEVHRAFPAPADLCKLEPARPPNGVSVPRVKLDWLRGLAERGLGSDFEAESLLALDVTSACRSLEQSPGIGPWASEFALIRGVGVTNLLPSREARFFSAVQRYYGFDPQKRSAEWRRVVAGWQGYESWAAFLLRVALQQDTKAS